MFWLELGTAQVGLKQWTDAETSLRKALDVNSASSNPDVQIEAGAENEIGEALASDGNIPEALEAYDAAAKENPARAGIFYENETIVMARTRETAYMTGSAADKAIAADPTRPVPYYLKGQALINQARIVNGRTVPPPGCVEAYQKYLELAPNGQFAQVARQVLASLQ